MGNRWVRMAVVFVLGLAALKGWEFAKGGSLLPMSETARKVAEAGRIYNQGMADLYEAAAKAPAKTRREQMEPIVKARDTLFETREKAVSDLMDSLGNGEQDEAKARVVYGEIAKGYRQ